MPSISWTMGTAQCHKPFLSRAWNFLNVVFISYLFTPLQIPFCCKLSALLVSGLGQPAQTVVASPAASSPCSGGNGVAQSGEVLGDRS